MFCGIHEWNFADTSSCPGCDTETEARKNMKPLFAEELDIPYFLRRNADNSLAFPGEIGPKPTTPKGVSGLPQAPPKLDPRIENYLKRRRNRYPKSCTDEQILEAESEKDDMAKNMLIALRSGK